MRKRVALLIIAVILCGSINVLAQPGTSPDWSTVSAWAERDAKEAYELEILQPIYARDFGQTVTRAEFCDFCGNVILKWYDCRLDEAESVPILKAAMESVNYEEFTDLDSGSELIRFCARLGIVSGMGDGTFRPEAAITREQAAVMLCKTLDITTTYLDDLRADDENGVNSAFLPHVFKDGTDIQNWARQEIYTMYNLGVMMGDTNNNFNPQEGYTREQSVCTFLRLYKLIAAPDEVNAPEKTVYPTADSCYYRTGDRYYLDAAYDWGNNDFEPVYYDGDGKKYTAAEKGYVYPTDEKYMAVLTSTGVGVVAWTIIGKDGKEVTNSLKRVDAVESGMAVYMENFNAYGDSVMTNLDTGEEKNLHLSGERSCCGLLQFYNDERNVGYCDINGNIIIPPIYKDTHTRHTFLNDLCVLQKQNGSLAIVNTKGEELKTFSLDLEKYYIAEVMGTNIILGKNGVDGGKKIIYRAYSEKTIDTYAGYNFTPKGNIIAYKKYKPYLLDPSGNLICDLSSMGYDGIDEAEDLYFRVYKVDTTNYSKVMPCDIMDYNGKIIRKGVGEKYKISSDGLTAYKSANNEITVFDVRGKDIGVVTTPEDINSFDFLNGLLNVNYGDAENKNDIWAYYTPDGKEAVLAAWSN